MKAKDAKSAAAPRSTSVPAASDTAATEAAVRTKDVPVRWRTPDMNARQASRDRDVKGLVKNTTLTGIDKVDTDPLDLSRIHLLRRRRYAVCR